MYQRNADAELDALESTGFEILGDGPVEKAPNEKTLPPKTQKQSRSAPTLSVPAPWVGEKDMKSVAKALQSCSKVKENFKVPLSSTWTWT